jgi:hypothetical protein
MGQWINETQLHMMRGAADATCGQAPTHEQISVTMPFCRHCGEPMPLADH